MYVTLTGRILDAETNQPITSTPEIAITYSNNGQTLTNDATGAAYSVKVPTGSMVHISAGAENYVGNALEIQAPATDATPSVTQDISLAPSHARIYGHVINSYKNTPIKATVVLEQLAGGVPPVSVESDPQTGAYSFNVNPLISYRISTKVPDFQPYEDKIDVPAAREKLISIQKEIRLTPEAVQGFMVFFDVNKFNLKPEELAKFPDFIRSVKENPQVRFEINGHTDSTGSEGLNQVLSENRAKAVSDYLLNQGIPREQIAVVQGFGKSQPLDPNNLARNRRVEVQIVGRKD
jgi:outer membrane protein OmpA-like peptidoglycan-associated protein